MKRLILTITGSLMMLCSGPDKTVAQNAMQSAPAHTLVTTVPESWLGKYSAYFSYGDVAGQQAGWALEIVITKNKITATGDGFQMAFVDELKAKVSGSKLILTHFKNVSGYPTGKSMNPEFTLIKNHGKFYIQSKWIASTDVVEKPTALGYKIDKTKSSPR